MNPNRSLTKREIEVMELVAKGLHNKEIGRQLCITTGTVEQHLSHIFAKLGVGKTNSGVGDRRKRRWIANVDYSTR